MCSPSSFCQLLGSGTLLHVATKKGSALQLQPAHWLAWWQQQQGQQSWKGGSAVAWPLAVLVCTQVAV
jgi:hypothetical protein